MSIEVRPDERFQRSEGLDVNKVPDGCVVYQAAIDRVHFLNPTAMVIFELCDGNLSVSEIQEILVSAYELEHFPDEDFFGCFSDLVAEGLVVRCSP